MAADLKAFLLNCFIGGEVEASQPEGSRIRNKIESSFGGRDITIIQRPEIMAAKASELRGQAIKTTTVIVPNVQVDEREKVLNLLCDLSWLLSFATGSNVALCGWEQQGSRPSGEHWAVVARGGYFRPPFDIHDGAAIRTYLECVQREYFRLKETRQLQKAIHLLVLAETSTLPQELQLATMFILLENLKSTFAAQQGYPFKNGNYMKAAKERWSFVDLLSEMFDKIGMSSSDLNAIKNLRNEIVHSGISQTSYEHQEEIYESCQNLVREYFLRLLSYTGSFRLFSGHGMTVKRI